MVDEVLEDTHGVMEFGGILAKKSAANAIVSTPGEAWRWVITVTAIR